MLVSESVPTIAKIKQYVDWDDFSRSFKKKFTREFFKNLKNKNFYVPKNDRATVRKLAIESFVEAWDMTCNKSNCLSSATSIGLEPVNREAPKRNQYVRNLTPQEQEIFNKRVKRKEEILDINNCEITKDEKIAEIRNFTIKTAATKVCVLKYLSFKIYRKFILIFSKMQMKKECTCCAIHIRSVGIISTSFSCIFSF